MKTTTSFASTVRGLAILALLAPVASCFSPSYPTATPFYCDTSKPTPICPDGYECDVDGPTPDPTLPSYRLCKKPGGGTGPGGCLDDDLEPNDTMDAATNLDGSLAGHPQGVSLYGVEICTAEDVDYYSFTVTANKKATVLVQYTRDQGELQAELLDPAGAVLATGAVVGGGLQLEATLQAQPSLFYYLVVKAGPEGSKNKYDFSITFTNQS
jgi:hypothetical protein